MEIQKIVTHHRPHADELIALMFLQKFPEGEKKYPGVSKAKVEFLTAGVLPEGKSYKDFPDTIFLGVGGGPFDEHAVIGKKERVEGETCTTLVAKDLGIENHAGLKRILYFAKNEDLSASKVKDALSVMIKYLHSKYKDNFDEIAKWAIDAYFATYEHDKKQSGMEGNILEPVTVENALKYLEEQNYPELSWWRKFVDEALLYQDEQYKKALEEFKNKAKIEEFIASDGMPVDMAVVTSDSEEMNKAGRSNKMQLIIQFNSRGNVAIFTYRKRNLNLTKAFVLLRMAEQHYRGGLQIKDEKILSQEGTIENIPWYLFHSRDIGFNGSLTTKDIEPTKIPHDKVVALVKAGLQNM